MWKVTNLYFSMKNKNKHQVFTVSISKMYAVQSVTLAYVLQYNLSQFDHNKLSKQTRTMRTF